MAANGYSNGIKGDRKSKHDLSTLKINQSRLLESIHSGCEFGAAHRYGDHPTETGMARLSLNDADKDIRNWFLKTAKSLNCKTSVDQMGNLFAIRPGKKETAPPVMMGSHLDTQPTGGRYDGILGVNAGIEVLKTLHDNDVNTEGPVGVVNWTNEEGARFPMMAVSSGVWAEAVPLETAWNLAEVSAGVDGRKKTMKEELERIGYLGEQKASYKTMPFAAHFELHIEQGPILEDEQRKVGVVQGVQAFKWFNVTVSGRDTHAGTTPFVARKDPMLCAAKCIVKANELAKELSALATTGIIEATPGSINTMAHTILFTLDIRHTEDAKLAELEKRCKAEFKRIAEEDSEKGCTVDFKELVDSPAVVFHEDCVAVVEASAKEVCGDLALNGVKAKDNGSLWKYMISGAGHDSCYTNRRSPTSMIFTQTREGVSHNPTEYCSPEDCAIGTQVLLGAVLRYDQLRAERGDFYCAPSSQQSSPLR